MDLRNYFIEAQEEVNDEFFNYDGDDYDYDDDFDFVDDEDYGFDGEDDDSFDMATGGRGNAPTSQPYIVNVQNTIAGTNLAGVTILGSYNALANISSTAGASPRFGNAVGISITMGITGITYAEFLYQAMNTSVHPFDYEKSYKALLIFQDKLDMEALLYLSNFFEILKNLSLIFH